MKITVVNKVDFVPKEVTFTIDNKLLLNALIKFPFLSENPNNRISPEEDAVLLKFFRELSRSLR